MTEAIPYIVLSNAISLTIDNEHYVVPSTHPNFTQLKDAIKRKQWDVVPDLIDIPRAVENYSKGAVTVVDGIVKYNGLPVHNVLTNKMLSLMNEGFDISPWVNFMNKLYTNPSPDSITQLYAFLERAKLPLTPDGDFLAYKYVSDDFKDCHTGTFDNSPGKVVEMPREQVDSNPKHACSSGLHFCSRGYLSWGYASGDNVVLVKVNPRDVVSIPADHKHEKARACRYEVVGCVNKEYTFEDMESNAVLDNPLEPKVEEKTFGEVDKDRIVKAILRWGDLEGINEDLRTLSKNLGYTKGQLIALVPYERGYRLEHSTSDREITKEKAAALPMHAVFIVKRKSRKYA